MVFPRFVAIALGALCLTACQEREVRAYRIPKEKIAETTPPRNGAPAAAAAQSSPSAAAPRLTWTAQAGWQEKPAGGFRRGSFSLPGQPGAEADFSIIAFPGSAGGLVENLNRWRGQIGLSAFTEEQANSEMDHVDGQAGLHFHVVDYAGEAEGKPTRILGAVLEFGGESWFFKVMGPSETVAAQKPSFLSFLQSVQPAGQ